jgi:hypothetical protein
MEHNKGRNRCPDTLYRVLYIPRPRDRVGGIRPVVYADLRTYASHPFSGTLEQTSVIALFKEPIAPTSRECNGALFGWGASIPASACR